MVGRSPHPAQLISSLPMICAKYQCLFVHIPKTAGQSIEGFFLDLVGRTGRTREALLLKRNMDPSVGPKRLSHLAASEYVTWGYLRPIEFRSLYKFSFVRNPWDRLVSAYEFRKFTEKPDFKTFLFNQFPTPRMGAKYLHVKPQYKFLYNKQGSLLVDHVGRFETLQTDFDAICKKIGISNISTILPHKNQAKSRKPYLEYYDNESKEYTATMYRRDLELFNYTFGS